VSEKRRPGELTFTELVRWVWRQLTSMRTALVLLLLLALAAVPGSVVPQGGVDPLAVTRWKNDNPELVPIYEWLGLFNVYSSPWFAAIYLLLVISLVGCILPRTAVYWRALRAQPPAALTPGFRRSAKTRMPRAAKMRTAAAISFSCVWARRADGCVPASVMLRSPCRQTGPYRLWC
jgi:hypothetical protein